MRKGAIMHDNDAGYEVLNTIGITFLTYICWIQINLFVCSLFFGNPAELTKESLKNIVSACGFLAIVLAGVTMTVVILKEEYKPKVIAILLVLAAVSLFLSLAL